MYNDDFIVECPPATFTSRLLVSPQLLPFSIAQESFAAGTNKKLPRQQLQELLVV